MKYLIALALGIGFAPAFAQQDSTAADTAKKKKKVTVEITLGTDKDEDKPKKKDSDFSIGLTLSRLDLGFSRYLDNGSFTLSPRTDFLEFEGWKTHNFGFEFFQMGYRFNPNFKVYIAGGLDWTHIRLKKDITFEKDQSELTFINEDIDFKKNRFSTQYLRIPLSLQFRTNEDKKGKRFYFVTGPEVGFLLAGKQKQISEERGKVKTRDDFNFAPFRYGAFGRLGYGNFGLFTKLYFNDVFAEDQGPADFKNIAFGLTFGF